MQTICCFENQAPIVKLYNKNTASDFIFFRIIHIMPVIVICIIPDIIHIKNVIRIAGTVFTVIVAINPWFRIKVFFQVISTPQDNNVLCSLRIGLNLSNNRLRPCVAQVF